MFKNVIDFFFGSDKVFERGCIYFSYVFFIFFDCDDGVVSREEYGYCVVREDIVSVFRSI